MKDDPEPVVQLEPLLVLYCQVALGSMPETVTAPLLLMRSVLEEPVSLVSLKVGAAGAVASMVMTAAFREGVVVVLPARSVCRRRTAPMA